MPNRRREHATPMLRQLHWLPVQQRVTFKLACLVHQSLSGHAPVYLADDITFLMTIVCHQDKRRSTRTQRLRQIFFLPSDRVRGYNAFKCQLKTY